MVFLVLGFFLGFILDENFFSRRETLRSGPQVEGAQVKSLAPVPTPTPRPTPNPTPTPRPSATPKPTPTPQSSPVINLPADLEELFSKYSTAFSVDKELLKRIARCESGLNPGAQTQDYAGLFQFSEALWVSTRTLMGENADLNLRLNAEEAIKTAAFMVWQNHLGIWPNCNK